MPVPGEPLRVGLFNVKFSPNLGDGLLSECLEQELGRTCPGIALTPLDLAGRLEYAEGKSFRKTALGLLGRSPAFVRQQVIGAILGRSLGRLRPLWRRLLGDLDAVILGGGNLFSDSDLNFPLKIDAALTEARTAGLPTAVYAVGVADNWTARGQALFQHALAGNDLVHVSVRDRGSREIWRRRLGPAGFDEPDIVRDPGLLVADHVPRDAAPDRSAPLVGIGLTHPRLLRYHADEPSASDGDLAAWVVDLVQACLRRGWNVALFCNGSPEDVSFGHRIATRLGAPHLRGRVTAMPRFHRPADLARFISGLDVMMGHRLHANIAAFSYAVPHVGFAWDSKLRRFLADVGRGDFLCKAGSDRPEAVVALAGRALAEGVDPVRHRLVMADARVDVARLGAALNGAATRRRSRPDLLRRKAVS